MDERELVAFLFRTLLEEEFDTKTSMSEALDVPFRTLQWIFQHLDTAKGASKAYQRLIWYCCEQNIDLTDLFRRFKHRRPEEGGMNMGLKRFRRAGDGEWEDHTEPEWEKVYEVFDLLLRTCCEACAERQAGGSPADCIVSRLADTLTKRREDKEQTTKEEEVMGKGNIGIMRWMLLEAFNRHFQGNHAAMAAALQLPEEDVRKALEIEQWRSGTEVFERLAAYCLGNEISLDDLMRRYPE